jgi:phosphoribosylformylglycinamidine (FGAM) synthase PurS component
MVIPVELTVSLKIPDVTALTARRALQGPMGYGAELADLRRADWWRLQLEAADDEAALALARALAEQTNVFVNPNKHVFQVSLHAGVRASRPGVVTVGVLTGFHDEAKAALALEALQGRLGYGEQVRGLELGTLWTFHLRTAEPAQARALAERMTVSHHRDSGLLVNPHSMWWRFV